MYCPKCGNKVEEGMAFCPRCGASLKIETMGQAPSQAAPPSQPQYPPRRNEKAEKGEKNEKQEKQQQPEKGEKHESQFGFVGFLVAGLILVLIGVVAYANAMDWLPTGISGALILLVIGFVIIIVGVYVATMARRRMPPSGPTA